MPLFIEGMFDNYARRARLHAESAGWIRVGKRYGNRGSKAGYQGKIISCQYNNSKEDVWGLLENYDRCLAVQATQDELAEEAFLRG